MQEQEQESQGMLIPKKAVSDEEQETGVKFDDILADLGDFGRHQKISYFLLFLPTIFSAMQKQSWSATAPNSVFQAKNIIIELELKLSLKINFILNHYRAHIDNYKCF